MKSTELLLDELKSALPGVEIELLMNPSVSAQHSLRVAPKDALRVAAYLRDVAGYDYCSNVTGVDWLDKETTEKIRTTKTVTRTVDGIDGIAQAAEEVVEETVKRVEPGCLEAVYHLYSMRLGPTDPHPPVVLRMRTLNRIDQVELPSLTPVWRAAEFQEREIFDLYGIVFTGHRDLRRILMWDEFEDHPMRRDYVDPDDFEYEPTPHDEVLKRAEEYKASLAAELPVGEVR